MKVVKIAIDKIEQNENSRVIYKSQDLAELMASMRKDGLLQPVGVREIGGGKYDTVFGNRRIMAAKKLGWKEIEANVVEAETDNDRDIINLVENFKRQNTTVSEDGRIFQQLKGRGLTAKEISARLGITEQRVQVALDVFNEFPEEFKNVIVNKTPGRHSQGKGGYVSASMALSINNIRRRQGLNRTQTRSLLRYAQNDNVNAGQINAIAPLLKSGMDLQKALGVVDKIESINLTVQVNSDHARKLEKKYGKSFHDLCYKALETATELKVARFSSPSIHNTNARLRKAAVA